MFRNMLSVLAAALHCPRCEYEFKQADIRLVDSAEDDGILHCIMHTDCGRCACSIIIHITSDGRDTISAAMTTDLTAKDAQNNLKLNSLTVDDVIALHRELNDQPVFDFRKLKGLPAAAKSA